MNELIAEFLAYRKQVVITRVRLSSVPAQMQPLVRCYLAALAGQLKDPENESWDSLGPNEHHNALQAVQMAFGEPPRKPPTGNCPRCGGSGHIRAYQHIHGGLCLRCGGSGNINK